MTEAKIAPPAGIEDLAVDFDRGRITVTLRSWRTERGIYEAQDSQTSFVVGPHLIWKLGRAVLADVRLNPDRYR